MQVLDCKLSPENLSSLGFDFFPVISFSSPNNFLKKTKFCQHSCSQHTVHITSVKEVNLMSGHM